MPRSWATTPPATANFSSACPRCQCRRGRGVRAANAAAAASPASDFKPSRQARGDRSRFPARVTAQDNDDAAVSPAAGFKPSRQARGDRSRLPARVTAQDNDDAAASPATDFAPSRQARGDRSRLPARVTARIQKCPGGTQSPLPGIFCILRKAISRQNNCRTAPKGGGRAFSRPAFPPGGGPAAPGCRPRQNRPRRSSGTAGSGRR